MTPASGERCAEGVPGGSEQRARPHGTVLSAADDTQRDGGHALADFRVPRPRLVDGGGLALEGDGCVLGRECGRGEQGEEPAAQMGAVEPA